MPILVRATVNLPGLQAGETTVADATDPYVQMCLENELVVPIPEEELS